MCFSREHVAHGDLSPDRSGKQTEGFLLLVPPNQLFTFNIRVMDTVFLKVGYLDKHIFNEVARCFIVHLCLGISGVMGQLKLFFTCRVGIY